jgi:hypothetical protein
MRITGVKVIRHWITGVKGTHHWLTRVKVMDTLLNTGYYVNVTKGGWIPCSTLVIMSTLLKGDGYLAQHWLLC